MLSMVNKTLTSKEKREAVDFTIGRLRVRLRDYHKDERGLELLEKIVRYLDKVKPIRV